ncbi:SpoIIE family protein phosphatase [Streptomyces coeruleorubidus]|nr:SpoIIE family protein phosphatase [Streptomyces coeruleorubidus]WDV56666.1 SpoIIE family protein phosphatase [Streptomyces coeruleorubidus]
MRPPCGPGIPAAAAPPRRARRDAGSRGRRHAGRAARRGLSVTALTLAPGSVLALYTDGLVEQPGSDIETDIEEVRRCLADTPADSVDRLADRLVRTARRARERPDDVALLLTAYR